MSMNQGRAVKTQTGWRFGTTLQGVFYGLGYCSQCDGHPTAQDAMAHYQQFLTDKAAVSLVRAKADGADDDGTLGAALRAQPGQPDQRRCIVCGTAYDLRPDRNAAIQSWRCESCQEKVAAEADAEQATARLAKYRAMIDTIWVECIPDDFRNATLANFDLTGVSANIRRGHAKAVKWAEAFNITQAQEAKSLIFLSKPGTGKTHLSAAILRAIFERLLPSQEELLERIRYERALALSSKGYDDTVGVQQFLRGPALPIERYTARLVIAPELLNRLVEARFHREGQPSEEDLYLQVASTRLLIIDDLGRVSRANQEREQEHVWFRILNARYNSRLPTIITTNKTMEQLYGVVGEAVADRMSERFDFVDMTGESYRGRKRA